MEFRQVRGRRVTLGLFLVGPPALFEVRDADGTVTVSAAHLSDTLGVSGRDYQEMTMTAARLFAVGDPGWVQLPCGGAVRVDS